MFKGISVDIAKPAYVWALALGCSLWVLFAGTTSQRLSWTQVPAGLAAADLVSHAHYGAAFGEALAQAGSWVPREAPRARWPELQRYPFYQFYSFFPYQVSGLLVRAGVGPYHAVLALLLMSFMAGGLGLHGLLRALGWGPAAGLLGCAAYTFAPYHVTDLYGRYAVVELASFGLVPWVFWGALLSAKKPGLGSLLFSSLSWCLLILTHNIFHVWSVPLVAVWLLQRRWMGEDSGSGLTYAGLGYGLGLAMALFFFAVPLLLGPKVLLAASFGDSLREAMTPMKALFHPGWAPVEALRHMPTMSVQLGWPFMGVFLWMAFKRRWGALKDGHWILFALVVFGAWSPVDFWPYLGPFRVIQFPMRLLLYACLFGSLMLGDWMHGLPEGKARRVLPWLLAGLALGSLPWKRVLGPPVSAAVIDEDWLQRGPHEFTPILNYAIADVWRQTLYRGSDLWPQRGGAPLKGAGPGKLVFYGPRLDRLRILAQQSGAVSTVALHTGSDGDLIVLPALWYPGLYRVEVDGSEQPYGFVGANLALPLKAGDSKLSYAFVGYPWANRVSMLAWLLWLALLWLWERRRHEAKALPLA